MQPTTTFHCSLGRNCSQYKMIDTFPMLNDTGKCSALLTRKGFFDFVIFRTHCNTSYNVRVVCQRDNTIKEDLYNNMSDIKISNINGYHSLQAFSSCDAGWFLIDNVCVNFYPHPASSNNTATHMQCAKHGGQLAYNVLKNVTITTPGNTLDSNTELSLFWQMFHHMGDINFTESFHLDLHKYRPSASAVLVSSGMLLKNISSDRIIVENSKKFVVNGSDLCKAYNMSTRCNHSGIVLSVRSKDVSFHGHSYKDRLDIFGRPIIDRNIPCWSLIYELAFQTAEHKCFTLCEKSLTHTLISTNCSDLYMTCDDGTCVHDSLVCDGQQHCPHGEDEADCQHISSGRNHSCISHCHHRDLCVCTSNYFLCFSGGCVPL